MSQIDTVTYAELSTKITHSTYDNYEKHCKSLMLILGSIFTIIITIISIAK